MRNPLNMRHLRRLLTLCAVSCAMVVLPLLTSSAKPPVNSVNIINNSNRVIRYVYLSHVNADDWSGNQLPEGQAISPGQSATVSNYACDQSQVKVIGEDQDGCFLSGVVACAEGASWTITNETAANCGQ